MEVAGGEEQEERDIRQCLRPCKYLLEKPRTLIRTWDRGGPALVPGLHAKEGWM